MAEANSAIQDMSAIGLLGGTFNPIHLGHLHLAQQALLRLQLSQVRFIPSAVPALKQSPTVRGEHRAAMVKLAIQDQPQFVLDHRELQRGGVSYSVDTLRSLRQELGAQIPLIWLMGSDAYANIQRWHEWSCLLDLCHIAVIQRPTNACPLSPEAQALLQQHQVQQISLLHHTPHGHILLLDIAAPNISSTNIRQRISQQQTIQQLVPQAVADYIQENKLYQE